MTTIRVIKDALSWLFDHTGDPRFKNSLIAILALMSVFGIIAPEKATALRDAVMSLAL